MKIVNVLRIFFCYAVQLKFRALAWSPAIHRKSFSFPSSPLHAVSSDTSIETFDGTKGIGSSIINEAAEFMMKSFWGVTDNNPDLLSEQVSDLENRHGEILGKRKLFSNLIMAKSENEIMGMVGVEVALLDLRNNNIMNYKQSGKTLTDAVASLGPKQRRQYKDATIEELVKDVPSLAGNFKAVAVLANLCVSPSSRGMGLGDKLCSVVEDVVSNDWGMGKLMLKVEGENVPAKKLYEKLGFVVECTDNDASAIRPNLENNSFHEVPCEMLTLSKSL
jgi:ribosomal protein S18 acetylase RimI-like enzyme